MDNSLTGLDTLGVYGTLQGAGTLGATSVYVLSGRVGVDPAGFPGTTMLDSGSVSMYASTLAVQLNSDTAYDQLNVAGTVDLALYGQATNLQVSLGYTPSIGQQFTLINNDDTDAILSIFKGYAEGDLVLVGNVAFRISYVGGELLCELWESHSNPPTKIAFAPGRDQLAIRLEQGEIVLLDISRTDVPKADEK